MAFVLDSSVALSWCFEDEVTEATLRIRERLSTERAVVPSLWLLEVTAYDAAYLQVAAARRLPLATLDATLAEAARAAGVDLLG